MDTPRRKNSRSLRPAQPLSSDEVIASRVTHSRTTLVVDLPSAEPHAAAEFKTSIEYDGFCTLYRLLDDDGSRTDVDGGSHPTRRLLGTCGEPMN